MDSLTFEGKVFSGEGNGKKFLSLPWVKRQIEEKLGFSPYLGTLNIKLTEQSTTRRGDLDPAKALQVLPAKGFCVGLLFRAHIDNTKCAVILPQVKGYPKDVFEIIAAVNLREAKKLKDGDTVKVAVDA